MTPEKAYEEALRRIREAEETGALELDLSRWQEGEFTGFERLNRLPPELAPCAPPYARSNRQGSGGNREDAGGDARCSGTSRFAPPLKSATNPTMKTS
jgi:hypothetical protein